MDVSSATDDFEYDSKKTISSINSDIPIFCNKGRIKPKNLYIITIMFIFLGLLGFLMLLLFISTGRQLSKEILPIFIFKVIVIILMTTSVIEVTWAIFALCSHKIKGNVQIIDTKLN